MTTRKTRFDGKTIIKKYNEYKSQSQIDIDNIMISVFVFVISVMPLIFIFTMGSPFQEFSKVDWVLSIIGLTLHIIVDIFAIKTFIFSVTNLIKGCFWIRQFKEFEERRQ